MDLAYTALWAQEHATKLSLESPDHGPSHWRDVARIGLYLAEEVPDVDMHVMWLFAALHDTQREDEFEDPDHGERAWAQAKQMYRQGIIDPVSVNDEQMSILCAALIGHDKGSVIGHPTIGACWDADRMTISRVGKKVNPSFISTDVIRNDLVGWLLRCEGVMDDDDMPWEEIAKDYRAIYVKR